MKRLLMLMSLVVLCCLGCQQDQNVAAVDVEAEIQAVRDSEADYYAAINAGDVDKVVSIYSQNAVIIAPNYPPYAGKESIHSFYKQIFDSFTAQVNGVIDDIQVSGDLAVAYSTYSGTDTPKAGGEPFKSNGRSIEVFKKQPDRTWKIIYHVYSSESLNPPAQAE